MTRRNLPRRADRGGPAARAGSAPAPHENRGGEKRRVPRFLRLLGPGLITGAADDDPSGVSTYSTAGAAFGYALLWTAPFSLPLMITVQLMCARIGMVTGQGLAGVLRDHYPRWVLWLSCTLLLVANTINIGADLGAMAAVIGMLSGIRTLVLVPLIALLILLLLIYETYPVIVRVFKWLTLALFTYVGAAFLAHPDWSAVARATVVPTLRLDRAYILTLLAILGTTLPLSLLLAGGRGGGGGNRAGKGHVGATYRGVIARDAGCDDRCSCRDVSIQPHLLLHRPDRGSDAPRKWPVSCPDG